MERFMYARGTEDGNHPVKPTSPAGPRPGVALTMNTLGRALYW